MARQIAFLILATALSAPALADFSGRVVGVSDGDTLTVLHAGVGETIRLHGIDCPEKGQPFGQAAKRAASALAFDQEVTVATFRTEKYGRTLGEVTLPTGQSLNQELVRGGRLVLVVPEVRPAQSRARRLGN